MPFESSGERSFNARSPGGFEFGLQGFQWAEPRPTSITFYLDNTASVQDQYGRPVRRAITNTGELRFADTPPEASQDGTVVPRPQFATHTQVIAALSEERIDWTGYLVQWITSGGAAKWRGGLNLTEAGKMQAKLIQEGNRNVTIAREIACAGWPQLPYAELKKLPEIPPTPIEELRKIRDPALRKDALRLRREIDEGRAAEMAVVEEE